MPEAPGRAEDHKRATWVALRTLRQRPKIVDQAADGEPIYEVRSVRLILRDKADHFNRLAECSKCGREVPGAPVLSQSDLTRASHSVICKECVRTATVASAGRNPMPRESTVAPVPPPAETVSQTTTEPVAPAVDDARIAAVESQLGTILTLLTDLADVQRTESVQRREADAALQSHFRDALLQGLDDVRPQVASSSDVDPSAVDALEARVRQSFAGVVELVQSQRGELGTLGATVAETRSEVGKVVESNRALAAGLDDVASRLSAQPTPRGMVEAFRDEIAEVESRLAGTLDAQRAELQAALREGLTQARLEFASLEQELQGSVVALAELVEAQRGQLETALSNRLSQEMAAVVGKVDELTEAHDSLRAKLDGLLESAFDTETRLNALSSSAEAAATRMDALEQRTAASVNRLTRLTESERDMREGTRASHDVVAQEQVAPAGAPVTGSLLDALDRQLQEAELRLARRVSARDLR